MMKNHVQSKWNQSLLSVFSLLEVVAPADINTTVDYCQLSSVNSEFFLYPTVPQTQTVDDRITQKKILYETNGGLKLQCYKYLRLSHISWEHQALEEKNTIFWFHPRTFQILIDFIFFLDEPTSSIIQPSSGRELSSYNPPTQSPALVSSHWSEDPEAHRQLFLDMKDI